MVLTRFDIINIKFKDFIVTTWYDERENLSGWLQLFGVATYEAGIDERFRFVYYNPPIKFKNKDIHIEIFETGVGYIRKTLERPYHLENKEFDG